jgi:hypothetical protein
MRPLIPAFVVLGLIGGRVAGAIHSSTSSIDTDRLRLATTICTPVVAAFLAASLEQRLRERSGGLAAALLPLVYGAVNGIAIACIVEVSLAAHAAIYGLVVSLAFVPSVVVLFLVRRKLRRREGSPLRVLCAIAALLSAGSSVAFQAIGLIPRSATAGVAIGAATFVTIAAAIEVFDAIGVPAQRAFRVRRIEYRSWDEERVVRLPRLRALLVRRALLACAVAACAWAVAAVDAACGEPERVVHPAADGSGLEHLCLPRPLG